MLIALWSIAGLLVVLILVVDNYGAKLQSIREDLGAIRSAVKDLKPRQWPPDFNCREWEGEPLSISGAHQKHPFLVRSKEARFKERGHWITGVPGMGILGNSTSPDFGTGASFKISLFTAP
ncbi:MAG TPA: hypothetical protein VKV39_02460 [Candidatus Sulfotelmatobacter sp.]|nr:hypothetical protein [Candidatus Sulfotelmatobacter sp.]